MWEIEPGREVPITFTDGLEILLGPSSRNAISSDVRKVPDAPDGAEMGEWAVVPKGAGGILQMKTVYAEEEGWGVISVSPQYAYFILHYHQIPIDMGLELTREIMQDIDDTIKVTYTSSPAGILRSTFVSEPTPIQGMPDLYAHIHSLIGPAAPFFYLSASPYNLYGFLKGFREQYYPQGTIILRDASWKNLSGLLSTLTLGTQAYKVDRMKKIQSWLPKRKFIAIGDSTQSDPEAYGEMQVLPSFRTPFSNIFISFISKIYDFQDLLTRW